MSQEAFRLGSEASASLQGIQSFTSAAKNFGRGRVLHKSPPPWCLVRPLAEGRDRERGTPFHNSSVDSLSRFLPMIRLQALSQLIQPLVKHLRIAFAQEGIEFPVGKGIASNAQKTVDAGDDFGS